MKILFFDTETTGFIQNFAPDEKQPNVVQFGGIYGDYKFNEDGSVEVLEEVSIDELFNPLKPIPAATSAIHGITDEMVKDKPTIKEFLKWFVAVSKDADFVVGHNIDFDRSIMFLEIDRAWKKDSEEKRNRKKMFAAKALCTMKASIDYCGIAGPRGNKFPKLAELHKKIFGIDFDNAHNAFADIEATKNCFFELKKLKLL